MKTHSQPEERGIHPHLAATGRKMNVDIKFGSAGYTTFSPFLGLPGYVLYSTSHSFFFFFFSFFFFLPLFHSFISFTDWIGLDWIGLDWIGPDWRD